MIQPQGEIGASGTANTTNRNGDDTVLRAFIYYACTTNCLFISDDLLPRCNGHLTDALTDDSLQVPELNYAE